MDKVKIDSWQFEYYLCEDEIQQLKQIAVKLGTIGNSLPGFGFVMASVEVGNAIAQINRSVTLLKQHYTPDEN